MAGAADGEVTSAARPRDQRGGSAMRQALFCACASFPPPPPPPLQEPEVEKQVLESNPLLEAFGNARTLRLSGAAVLLTKSLLSRGAACARNDNSSRFGKLQPSVIVLSLSRPGLPSAFSTRFIELQFRSSGQVWSPFDALEAARSSELPQLRMHQLWAWPERTVASVAPGSRLISWRRTVF